ncbi:HEAT repeat domain-containing protein [Roseateles sp. 22389]|uniref:HEAT repeat domain-containing protein n=1 Tax=Roseateles sp. 22389 TaxID=3453916 RepID=UPI003F87F728
MSLVSPDIDPRSAVLRQRLTSPDAGVRRVALLDFTDVEDEALLPALVTVLRGDPDPALRAEAARALAGWGDGEVVEALADALADEATVREAAAQSLAELKDAEAGARLVPRVGHADGFVSAAALRALKELRVPAAAAPATAALAHADPAVRREAVGVLGWLKHAAALPALARLAIGDEDAEVRRAAAGALGLAAAGEAPSVLPALCAALRDPAWQVREEAATTLGKLGQIASSHGSDADAINAVNAANAGGAANAPGAANDVNGAIDAGEASSGNEGSGTIELAVALRQAMTDAYWQVRLRAARSLGRLRDAAALPVLIEALAHRAGNLRKEAAIALGEIGDPRALPALEAADADPDPEVRKAARLARQRLS